MKSTIHCLRGEEGDGEEKRKSRNGEGELVQGILYECMELSQ
jgi:hypothetical protein